MPDKSQTTIIPFPETDCGCAAANRKCWDGPALKSDFIYDVDLMRHRPMTEKEKRHIKLLDRREEIEKQRVVSDIDLAEICSINRQLGIPQ